MNHPRALAIALSTLISAAACGSADDPMSGPGLMTSTVLDLTDVKANPMAYQWFDFRPNVKKLILSGAAETEHVAILWYTVVDGAVGLHYHSKTESVYVIDGTQTDAKGVYPTGTVYFNPPGSGHQIMNSSGFFVLAYASPPDFMMTDRIGEYTPLRIDTDAPDLTTQFTFDQKMPGVRVFTPSLDATGGLRAEFLQVTSSQAYSYVGNYLLVLEGSCDIEGMTIGKDTLVVAKQVMPQPYRVATSGSGSCLALGVSF